MHSINLEMAILDMQRLERPLNVASSQSSFHMNE